jgi:hypothetical protein
MRKATVTYLYLGLLLLGCSKSSDTQLVNPLAGKTVVFMGDAGVGGYDASSTTNRWTTIFSSFMKCSEINMMGGNGNGHVVLQNGFSLLSKADSLQCAEWIPNSFDQATIPTKLSTYGALFIAYGATDAAIYGGLLTATDFQNKLSSVVDYAVNSKGWDYSQIVIVTPIYYTNWNFGCAHEVFDSSRLLDHTNAAVAVAAAKGCVSADVYHLMAKSTNPSSLLDATGIAAGQSLNDSGHRLIANFLTTLKYK